MMSENKRPYRIGGISLTKAERDELYRLSTLGGAFEFDDSGAWARLWQTGLIYQDKAMYRVKKDVLEEILEVTEKDITHHSYRPLRDFDYNLLVERALPLVRKKLALIDGIEKDKLKRLSDNDIGRRLKDRDDEEYDMIQAFLGMYKSLADGRKREIAIRRKEAILKQLNEI